MIGFDLQEFLRESIKIEGILREPSPSEISATERFLTLEKITPDELSALVHIYAPNHLPRYHDGMNVVIGNFMPPPGGVFVKCYLETIINCVNLNAVDPFTAHARFEWLHPFTDGNGRSGRALWLWTMHKNNMPVVNSSFLHSFYYQTLQDYQKRLDAKGIDVTRYGIETADDAAA